MTVTEATKFLNEHIADGVVLIENLTASRINVAFFAGDMSTYEDAVEVYSSVCDEHLYY